MRAVPSLHYGIQLDNLFYNSDQLQSLLAAENKKLIVAVRSHEHDVGFVHAQDPQTREFSLGSGCEPKLCSRRQPACSSVGVRFVRARFGDSSRRSTAGGQGRIQAVVDAAVRDKPMSNRRAQRDGRV